MGNRENQQEASTWQELLGQLINHPQDRERLAEAARVRSITLLRWASGVSKPREENLRTLLNYIPPDIYPAFVRLVSRDFPDLVEEDLTRGQVHQDLPAEFYAQAFSAHALTPQPMYRLAMQDLILQQALEQLDPERRGMSISLVCCVPPLHSTKVRSLREIGGLGTPPWKRDLQQKTIFLGAESLVGEVITKCHRVLVNSREEYTFSAAHWTEYEQSAVAFPLFHHARVAGCLLSSSAVPYYFKEAHLSLLERYSHLAALIFEPEEFFALEDIDLRIMPSYELQAPYFLDYNQRVSQKFTSAHTQHTHISLQEARLLVWQEIEDELLQLFCTLGK